jgi:hypothetical protein
METMERTTRITLTGKALEAKVDGEVIAMDIERGTCYGLNRVGSQVWEHMRSPITVDELCGRLEREYAVDASTCRSQVMDLLVELEAEGLVAAVSIAAVSISAETTAGLPCP